MSSRPALHAYINRIGAVERNFCRYVIEEEDVSAYLGGRRVVATIRIDADGTIECRVDEYAPTTEEANAIKQEIAKAPFPKSINARKGQLPPQLAGVNSNHFCIFYDPTGNEILFIQYRKEGEKPDLPYSFWSDGEWRCMEPDGNLPLFGLDRLKGAACIFLHEGAKGARDVQAMVDTGGEALAVHPWGEDLKRAVHLGWPGGAENADRVDWEPLRKLPRHVRIVGICDHDQVGIEAVKKISAILRRPMLAIMFDDHFPVGFDLADPWPTHPEWWWKKYYRGPTFDDYLIPATWATDILPTTDQKGRPPFKIREEFANEWHWVEEPAVFVHKRQTNRLRSESVFNHSVRPFSNAENTARLLVQRLASRCDGVAYRPCKVDGRAIINVDGRRLVNTFRPTAIKAIKGDARPFIRFLLYLFPNRHDRREVMRWIATLIARPDVRMRYSVLLVSETQGVGKGTLGEAILAPLIGLWNCSFPSEPQVVDSAFNSWIAHKRLAVIHEIYSGQNKKGYDRLKSVITDTRIDVNPKYVPAYTLENYLHVVACSNSSRALHLDDGDRRWLVPRVTEKQQPPEYWRDLHEWLKGDGLGIIRQWAEDHAAKPGVVVDPGEHAPMTAAKQEVIGESRSEGQLLAHDLAEQVCDLMKEEKEKVVLAVVDVRNYVAARRGLNNDDHRLEKLLTLRNALKAAGLKEPTRPAGQAQQRFTINNHGKIIKSHIVANFEIGAGSSWPDLKQFYKQPKEIWPM